MIALLRRPAYAAVLVGHFAVDVLNSQTGVLLAALSVPLALNNSQVALVATLYGLAGSLAQPVFGWLTDRYPGRWAAAGGILVMAAMFGLFLSTPGWPAFVFLIGAALCSAAFHPAGAEAGARGGGLGMATATAASGFFLFGQIGLSIGPIVSGYLLEQFGWTSLYGPVVAVTFVGVLAFWMLPRAGSIQRPRLVVQPGPIIWQPLLLAIMIGGLRVWSQSAIANLGPKYLQDLGLTSSVYAAVIGMFLVGIAIGGVFGGWLGERIGHRAMAAGMLAVSAPLLYVLPTLTGLPLFGVALLAGIANGGPHSALVVIAQRAMPERGNLASGLALGLMFGLSSLGVWLSGLLSDQYGLGLALQGNALLDLTGALLALGLPGMAGVPAGVASRLGEDLGGSSRSSPRRLTSSAGTHVMQLSAAARVIRYDQGSSGSQETPMHGKYWNKRAYKDPRMSAVQGAIWLVGIGVLALTDWWWPGILFVIAASTLLGGFLVQALPPLTPDPAAPAAGLPRMGSQPPTPAPPVMSAVGVTQEPPPVEVKLPARCPNCGGPTGAGAAHAFGNNPHVCHYCGSRLT